MNQEFTPGTRVYFGDNDGRSFAVIRQIGKNELELLISPGSTQARTRIVHVIRDEVRTSPSPASLGMSIGASRLPHGFRPRRARA